MRGTSGAPASRVPSWLVAAALAVVAVAVRALPRQRVFVGEDIVPFGNDAWYHLRRIVYSVVRFPDVLSFDRYINHPEGAKPIWTPVFDWCVALVARPFFVPGEVASIERVAVWVPPLLGAATVVVVLYVGRRHLDAAIGVVAAALLCVLPAHFWYSQLGFIDHHAAVALVSAALLGASMDFVAGGDDAPAERLFRRGTFPSGLFLGGALLVWPGSLLHVALAELGLAVYVLTRREREAALLGVRSFAAAQLVACVLVTPLGAGAHWPQWSEFSPLVLSRFQPWLFGVLAVLGILCAALWARPALGSSRGRRFASAVGVGLLALLLAFVAWPELGQGVVEAWQWLARDEEFQSLVNESQPLLLQQGSFSLGKGLLRLSGLLLVFPLAWLAALAWAWQREDRAPLLLWLGWAAALCAATLAQRRFFNSFSVPFALLMGWGICQAWRRLPGAIPWLAPGLARGAVALAALASLAPTWDSYARDLQNELRPAGGETVPSWLLSRFALVEMARWMGNRTPTTSGWLDAAERPEYGVMAPWDLGHAIEYAARRPTVVDNFGDDVGARNFRLAARYWSSPEPQASEILDRLRARYVVVALAQLVTKEQALESVTAAMALQPAPPSQPRHPDDPPPLERHRLVYESRPWGTEPVDGPPLFRVFEHVKGALIVGQAPPGSPVEARVSLRSGRPRELVHRVRSRADAEGHYTMRVPYSNHGAPRGVRVTDHYQLSCDGGEAVFAVVENAVQRGSEVRVPPCPGGD